MNVTRYGDDGVTYRFRDDSLRIDFRGERPAFVISGQELLRRQLLRVGQGAFPATSVLEAASDKLLTYSDDDLTILFSNMSMQRRDSTLWLDDVTLDAVMSR